KILSHACRWRGGRVAARGARAGGARAYAAHRRAAAGSPGRCGTAILARRVSAGARAIGLDHRTQFRVETRWTKFRPEETRKYAAELVALAPDVILAAGTSTVGPLLRLTRTVPIVFPLAADPVAAGLVESLARPGGNATGFMSFEAGISAKWLELLKE